MPEPTYHVKKSIVRPAPKLVTAYRDISPATAYEVMGKGGAMSSAIRPVYSGMRVCGPAVTVRAHIGDSLMILKSITVAEPGDVIVADVGDSYEAVCWGGSSSTAAKSRGIAGFVCNGMIRDGLQVKELAFPAFGRGLSVKGTVKESLGWINHPISVGGVTVNPGDLILGNDDGVVVIPGDVLDQLLPACCEFEEKTRRSEKRMSEGESVLQVFGYDKLLREKGLTEEGMN